MSESKPKSVLVWDLPLRIWHWAFAIAVLTALTTALVDPMQSIVVHQWAGITVFCLLVFRLTWGIWGGLYARWKIYRTTPQAFINHFLGRGRTSPHTSPGIVMALLLMVAAIAQSTTGLFMTDDIFFEAPLHRWIDGDAADMVDDVHSNAWRLIGFAVGVHLIAHLVYGVLLRDPISLSMFTGRKYGPITPTSYRVSALLISASLALVAFMALYWLAD